MKFDNNYNFLSPDKQKRKFARYVANLDVDFTIDKDNYKEQGKILDLSAGGAQVETSISLFVGEIINMHFKLEGHFMEVKAEVVRVTGKKAGVNFTDISEENKLIIQNFIHNKIFTQENYSKK